MLSAEKFADLPVAETVEIIPAEMRAEAALYERLGEEGTFEMDVVAPAPARSVAGGYASAGLLAWVTLSKLVDHQPLFHQERWRRDGAPGTRASRWPTGCQRAGNYAELGIMTWALILSAAVQRAARRNPSLKNRRITAHTFRHTAAMHLLQSGVAVEIVALWLGHASPVTTHTYVVADLKMREECLLRLDQPPLPGPRRRQTNSRLLGFLEAV